jgi:type IV pilus assembly protein PilV
MRKELQSPARERGVMLIEALIAILVFSIGILAVVGMQSIAIKNVTESKHRSEAAFLTEELLAQMWIDNGNIALYAYPGTGTVPARLTGWAARVNSKLPGAVQPKVTITGATAQGATVQIEVFWRLPEETTLGLPPHNHTVMATVYTS